MKETTLPTGDEAVWFSEFGWTLREKGFFPLPGILK